MQKAIECAKKISKQLDKNCLPLLEEANLHKTFLPIYKMSFSIEVLNTLCCFVIFAYDNDSSWLNLKQDRLENKKKILAGLNADIAADIFSSVLINERSEVNDVIGLYLEEQATWKFRTVLTLLDYHSNMIRFANQKTEEEKSVDKLSKDGIKHTLTEDYDIETLTKVAKQKGELLEQAIKARERADQLLTELKKEFVQLDNAVNQDFGFELTDEKKIDHMKWRDFIKFTVIPLRQQAKEETAKLLADGVIQ